MEIPLSLLYELADDSPLKGIWNTKSVPEKLEDLTRRNKTMPAPKHTVGKQVTVDGKQGQVVTVFDFGEDGPARYQVKIGKKEIEVGEDQIVSDEPEVKATETEAVDSGAEAEAIQASSEDLEVSGAVGSDGDVAGPDHSDTQPGN